jgi:glycosyltransferase involved in cell wall biosynthesis
MNPCSASETQAEAQRFLLVSGDFVPSGGMETANYHLAKFIVRTGKPVHLVAHRVDRTLTMEPNVVWHKARRPLGSSFLGEPLLAQAGRRVACQLGETGTRMIVNGGNCPLSDVNWVHFVHAAEPDVTAGNILRRSKALLAHRVFVDMEEIALSRARLIIANSNRTKRDLIRCYGLDQSIIHVVYCGVNAQEFYPADPDEKAAARADLGFPREKFLITFVGALSDRRKGLDSLLAAWEALDNSVRANSELIVVGGGAELTTWKKRVRDLKIKNAIRFLGFRRDVPRILRASDALVAPTRYEPFGLAVLEALCCGLPAVVSRYAGVTERYGSRLDDLLLDDPENIADLRTRLHTLITKRGQWTAIMETLSANLRAYTWEDMAYRFCSLTEHANFS